MIRAEAAQILGISPKANRKQADAAYAALLRQQTVGLQNRTDPDDRDLAGTSIKLLGQAYQIFTGSPPPQQVQTNGKVPAKSPERRVSLGAGAKPSAVPATPPPARRSISNSRPAVSAPSPAPASPPSPVSGRTKPRKQVQRSAPPPPGARPTEFVWAWGIVLVIVLFTFGFIYEATR